MIDTATASPTDESYPAQCITSCAKEAAVREWDVVCGTESRKCGACQPCVNLKTAVCPRGWFSHSGSCYTVHSTPYDFGTAQAWCQAHGADLVSINSEIENHFVWELCGTGTHNPLLYPLLVKRDVCWLGATEVLSTGDKDTSPLSQSWVWPDGTSPTGYTNWRRSPDGALYNEPNNGRDGPNKNAVADERTAVMNDPAGAFSGKWYDKPSTHKALPACEMPAQVASVVVSHHQTAKKTEVLASVAVVNHRHGRLRGGASDSMLASAKDR